MGIEDRVVLISGAGGALGQRAAKEFAGRGARLVLVDASAERLQQFSEELGLGSGRLLTRSADLSQAAPAAALVGEVLQQFGRLDIWLHLVGGWNAGEPVHQVEKRGIEAMLTQHLWTTFHLAQAVIPAMQDRHFGRILVVSSPRASEPEANTSPFAIGKAAQEALMLTIARENRDSGITANILLVDTIDVGQSRGDADRGARNWTKPEEIVTALLFLSSDDARMINGARIPLYGG